MKLAVVLILSVFCVSNISSRPKNSEIIPKDFYKRQILQPIPGYIPVYIKADGVPLIRTEKEKHASGKTHKVVDSQESNEFRSNNKEEESKKEEKVKIENPVKEKENPTENTKKSDMTKEMEKLEKIKVFQAQSNDQKNKNV